MGRVLRRLTVIMAVLLSLPTLGLAEDKATLMRMGKELACNSICQRWMSYGQSADAPQVPPPAAIVIPASGRPTTETPKSMALAQPARKSKLAAQRTHPPFAASEFDALPPPRPHFNTPPLMQVVAQPTELPPSDEHAETSAPVLPVYEIADAANLIPDVVEQLNYVAFYDLPQSSDDVAEPYQVGLSTGSAEVLTSALVGFVLLLMAILPLTSRRRRGNPSLWANVRRARA